MVHSDETSMAVRVENDADGRSLTAWVRAVGDDVVIVISGGDRPHVGCVVLALPSPARGRSGFAATSSILVIPSHKEEPIARPVAEAVCSRLGKVTTVTAGVHEDGIDRKGIESYLGLAEKLADAVVHRMRSTD
jgi:hypothetical protein